MSMEGNQQASLAQGGIPWYVEQFDPDGTTIYEERWTGPEVLRGMSEELSEMDDDELQGLGPTDVDGTENVIEPSLEVVAPSAKLAKLKKNGKRKRRWGGFK